MIYHKYGEAFKQIRLQHRYKISDFDKIGIPKSTLSNFENGKSMISLNKLDSLLQEMHSSLFEYSLLVNNHEPDYVIKKFQDIEDAYLTIDNEKLISIYEDIKNYGDSYQLLSLSAKSPSLGLDADEVEIVKNYLESVEIWGYYELGIFVNTIYDLPLDLVKELLHNFWMSNQYLHDVTDYRLISTRALTKGIMRLIGSGEAREAQILLQKSKDYLWAKDLTNRVMLHFAEGYYKYKFEDKKIGKELMQETLQILKILNAEELFKLFTRHFDNILQAKNEK